MEATFVLVIILMFIIVVLGAMLSGVLLALKDSERRGEARQIEKTCFWLEENVLEGHRLADLYRQDFKEDNVELE